MTSRRRVAAVLVGAAAIVFVVVWRSCGTSETDAPRAPTDLSVAGAEPRPRQPRRAHPDAAETPAATPAAEPSAAAPAPPAPRIEVLVVDADGRPALGASVVFTTCWGDTVLGPAATTDAEGRAMLPRPADRGHEDMRSRATRGDQIAFGMVHDGPVSGETLRLATDVVVVRGRVTGPDAAPIAGAFVTAAVSAFDLYPLCSSAKTEADGTFRLGALPADACAEGLDVSAGLKAWSGARRNIDAETARRDVVSFVLSPARHVRGRCVTKTGEPVPLVQVRVGSGWRNWMETDDDGRFDLEFDAAEPVTVTGIPKEHAAFIAMAPAAPEGVADLGDIVLHAGGTISGCVVDETGAVPLGARLHLVAEGVGEVREDGVDEEGKFELTGAGDGPHVLLADAEYPGQPPRHGRVAAVRAGDSAVRVVVTPGRAICLRVVAAEDGRPLEFTDCALRIRSSSAAKPDTDWWLLTNSHSGGPHSTETRLVPEPGRYDVAFAVPGRRPAIVRGIDVKDDAITTADVVLWKP